MRKVIIATALLWGSATSIAQTPSPGVHIHHGFETGNLYRQMPELMQRAYLMGVVDGMLFSPMLAMQDIKRTQSLGVCIDRMKATDEQLRAIVGRYLDANPALWGDDMIYLTYSALNEACSTFNIQLLGVPK